MRLLQVKDQPELSQEKLSKCTLGPLGKDPQT